MDKSGPEIRLRRAGGSASNLGVALNAEASVTDTLNPDAPKAFLEIPEVKTYLLAGYEEEFYDEAAREFRSLYDETLGERVRENAGKTASFLESKGWDGQKYVDGVIEENPRGVEDLAVDHDDDKFHGHKEGAILVAIGDETYPEDDDFVWNLKVSKRVAEALAGQRGREGYQQALIAEVAKHMAVSSRLASTETPVMIIAK